MVPKSGSYRNSKLISSRREIVKSCDRPLILVAVLALFYINFFYKKKMLKEYLVELEISLKSRTKIRGLSQLFATRYLLLIGLELRWVPDFGSSLDSIPDKFLTRNDFKGIFFTARDFFKVVPKIR